MVRSGREGRLTRCSSCLQVHSHDLQYPGKRIPMQSAAVRPYVSSRTLRLFQIGPPVLFMGGDTHYNPSGLVKSRMCREHILGACWYQQEKP